MSVDAMYVIEVERDGMKKLFGPVKSFGRVDKVAMGMRLMESDAVIRVRQLNGISDDGETSVPAVVEPPPYLHPGQTTVDEQIASHVPDIHDHVG